MDASIDPNLMYMTAVVSLIGSITYAIKKCSDNGVAFRSNCCKGVIDVEVDTNKELDPDFFEPRARSGSGSDSEPPPPPSARL